MKRSIRSAGALLSLASAAFATALIPAAAATQPLLQRATFAAIQGSVVRVQAQREQGGVSIGTGVTVAPAIVVTNCHVIREAAAISISGAGSAWEITGQHADGNHDVCFLHAPNWPGTPVVFGERDALQLGEPVAALGFTGGMGISVRFGSVRALHSHDGGRIVESDTAFTSGASGGGLFDASGALVGLLTFRSRGESGTYYSLPVDWIRDRLPAEDQWDSVHPLRDAMPFWQRDAETLPYFMRAAPLYAEGRWMELADLAERWAANNPRDAEPLRVRGDALEKLERPHSAAAAYTDALRLAPNDARSWYGLALVYAQAGNIAASQRAEDALANFDRDLAVRAHSEVQRLRALRKDSVAP